ncbi:MAG: hypothetical protein RR250_06625 [Akkermansia sp.]
MKYYLSALAYPFRGTGWVRTAFAFVLVWIAILTDVIGGSMIVSSYLFVYMMKMVQSSGNGEEEMCQFPLFEGWVEGLILPFMRMIVVLSLSFGLMVLSLCLGGSHYVTWGLFAFGMIYFPMAFLKLAMTEDTSSSYPLSWWYSVKNMPWAYAGLVLFTGMIVGVVFVLYSFIISNFDPSYFLTNPIMLVIPFIIAPFIYLVCCMYMNVLGLFHLKHEDKFGW